MLDGETLWVDERVIVSPDTGIFVPVSTSPELAEGDLIGVVERPQSSVEVRTPFAGRLVRVVALEGERVQRHDRIAWLRAA